MYYPASTVCGDTVSAGRDGRIFMFDDAARNFKELPLTIKGLAHAKVEMVIVPSRVCMVLRVRLRVCAGVCVFPVHIIGVSRGCALAHDHFRIL